MTIDNADNDNIYEQRMDHRLQAIRTDKRLIMKIYLPLLITGMGRRCP